MVDLTQAHKASIELLGTRHTALVEAVRNYVNGSVQPSIDELVAAIEEVTTDIDTKEKMLLGLASRQAKKPVPSLILDFKTRHYLQGTRRPEKGYGIHDLLTVERATPKWVYNASGRLTEVPANQPAYQHDSVTGEPQGLLIEESRTNLLTWSEDFTQHNLTGIALEDGGAFPTGRNSFARLVYDGSNRSRFRLTSFPGLTADQPYVFSFFIGETNGVPNLIITSDAIGININLETASRATGPGDVWAEDCQGGRRFFVRVVPTIDSTNSPFWVMTSVPNSTSNVETPSNAGAFIDIWGIQLEEGSTPSSYIPTEDAPVTRAGDNVSRGLGEEFNPSAFSLMVSLSGLLESTNGAIISLSPQGNADTVRIRKLSGPNRLLLQLREATGNYTSGMFAHETGNDATVALSYSRLSNELIFAVNGTCSQLTIDLFGIHELISGGKTYSNSSNCVLNNAQLFPRALSEQELIDLTS